MMCVFRRVYTFKWILCSSISLLFWMWTELFSLILEFGWIHLNTFNTKLRKQFDQIRTFNKINRMCICIGASKSSLSVRYITWDWNYLFSQSSASQLVHLHNTNNTLTIWTMKTMKYLIWQQLGIKSKLNACNVRISRAQNKI